jgi:ACS family hexuronate transporter-like MFS transporter
MKNIGRYRWTICSLLFFATTINYLDRAVISLVKVKYLDPEFHWNKSDYAHLTVAFQLFYALGMLGAGRLIDKLGTRIGYALSLFLWSLSAMSHAFIRTMTQFFMVRAALGITESGNFPAAIKSTAEWFPKRERALATGIFNSGANIGAIIAPLTVPYIADRFGWRLWLIFWFIFYEVPNRQKRLEKKEYEYIHSDLDEKETDQQADKGNVSWFRLLEFKQTWAFVIGKFLTDGVWWFYLFWLPDFLKEQYNIQGTGAAFPVAIVYIVATFGSVFGGWLPLQMIRNGAPVFKARKSSMLVYAFCALPVIVSQTFGSYNMWFAVLIIGFAAAAHQAWSANIFTTVSDMFPKKTVGSVTGIGGMAGGIGGVLVSLLAGSVGDYYKSIGNVQKGYLILFICCGFAYIIAWLLMHVLVPRMKKVEL